jgi:hypothetical protein
MKYSQYLFKQGQSYYLVELERGSEKVTLKVKEHGWSDTWSLPLDFCDHLGRTKEDLTDYTPEEVAIWERNVLHPWLEDPYKSLSKQ